jgi:hypothetical protein
VYALTVPAICHRFGPCRFVAALKSERIGKNCLFAFIRTDPPWKRSASPLASQAGHGDWHRDFVPGSTPNAFPWNERGLGFLCLCISTFLPLSTSLFCHVWSSFCSFPSESGAVCFIEWPLLSVLIRRIPGAIADVCFWIFGVCAEVKAVTVREGAF